MSQHKFKVRAGKQVFEVLAGWDRPLQHHFLVVERLPLEGDTEDEGETIFTNLQRSDLGMSIQEIADVLNWFGLPAPENFLETLYQDMEEDAGNKIVTYPEMVLTPLQAGTVGIALKVEKSIEEVGWNVISVMADPETLTPPFSYTVGLANMGLPELICSGVGHPSGAHILNSLIRNHLLDEKGAVRRDVQLQGTAFDKAANLPVMLRELSPQVVGGSHMFQTVAYHRAYEGRAWEAMQVVFPDREGRFPWDPGYNLLQQQLLWRQ